MALDHKIFQGDKFRSNNPPPLTVILPSIDLRGFAAGNNVQKTADKGTISHLLANTSITHV